MRKMKTIVVNIYVIILLGLYVNCSNYSFSGSGNPGINSIAIPVFDDVSSEFQIREKITDTVTEKFMVDNTLRVLSEEDSDSILRGTVVRVEDKPVSIRANETARAFEIYVYIKAEYIDKKSKKVFFKKNMQGRGTYSDPSQREDGIDEAVDKISQDLVNLVVSGW